MREWQVGDPVGDGNDIGVPDTEYMGYLKDRNGGSKKGLTDEFRYYYGYSFDFSKLHHDDDAFMALHNAFRIYIKMNRSQRSRIAENPFSRNWVIELCCRIANRHDRNMKDALLIILLEPNSAKLCKDCDLIYPREHECCEKCGKPLGNLKTPEDRGKDIYSQIKPLIFDENIIQKLVDASVRLMKSNDCQFVKIQRGWDFGIDFVFEKDHRYFRTTYVCAYNPQYMGPRVFEEFEITHNYDKLLADSRFIRSVRNIEKNIGFTFRDCSGGYGAQLDCGSVGFTFNDKIDLKVNFDMGDGRIAVFKIDLENMELSKEHLVF